MNNGILRYNTPASIWEEALPLGNGTLGMMVYGGRDLERVQLNEITMWSGYPYEHDSPETLANLDEMRRLVFEGNIPEAQRLCEKYLKCAGKGSKDTDGAYGSYETAGELIISFPDGCDAGRVRLHGSSYRRELHMREGMAAVSSNGINRKYLCSVKTNVCAIRIEGCEPLIIFTRKNAEIREEDGYIISTSRLPLYCATVTRMVREGEAYVIYSSTATAYKTDRDPLDAAKCAVDEAVKHGFEVLEAANAEFFSEILGRCELNLIENDDRDGIMTDKRIANPAGDLGLIEKYFMFGRYLLVCCSRGKLPSNLQGVWNKDYRAPWSADYHININIQMNYWFADLCGLSELAQPFYDYIEMLSGPGEITAKTAYGCRGWTAHTVTNPWGFTALGEFPSWGSFMCAGAWCCRHYWDHYLFTGDLEFLKRYWPVIRGSALFALDFLTEDPNSGYMVTCPSNSPENSFIDPQSGKHAYICAGPTMDNSILYELFTIVTEGSKPLGCDEELARQSLAMRDRLPPLRIGKHGNIMEWQYDYDEAEPGHRHMSNLYALHPASQITKSGTPELFTAAEKTLERRLAHGGGHTGWSRAWIINFYARLYNGKAVGENVNAIIEHSTLPNMFDNHPPFQIDGNYGAVAGIAEALLQSHEGFINVLPALPPEWKNGSFTGLRARGGWIIDAEWKDGKPFLCSVRAAFYTPKPMKVCFAGREFDAADGAVFNA